MLTHDLTGNLARFGRLRIISERTAALYRDRQVDVAKVGMTLGVPYVVLGQIQQTDSGPRVSVQLVDTTTRLTLWSEHLQREDGSPALAADDAARGIARMVALNITFAQARRLRDEPGGRGEIDDLLLRAHMAEIHGSVREKVSEALRLYEEALQRAPRNQDAMLGVARMHIVAMMNFVDLDPGPDIPRAERLLNEVLTKSPNSALAHFALGLLQKFRRQYAASMHSFQRCLELNPSFLTAQGQIGTVLTRMGQPEKGLALIQTTIRTAAPNDPALGFWYLFSAEAELELGHDQAALDWVLRADAFMPGSPLVHAWLASVYATMGDRPNAAKYVAALKKMAPAGAQRFVNRITRAGVRQTAGHERGYSRDYSWRSPGRLDEPMLRRIG